MKKKLQKSSKNRMLGGVCGGIAEYFDMDPTIVRIIAVILGMINGVGIIAYIICCIIVPKADGTNAEYNDDDVSNMKSANINPDEEQKNENSNSESGSKIGGHSDADFDAYFKK